MISELEKAREFPWNHVAENLKSAIETHPGPRSIWILTCASDDRDRGEDWSNTWMQRALPDRDLTRKHVGCDREEHWLMRKRARVRELSEQELDQLQK